MKRIVFAIVLSLMFSSVLEAKAYRGNLVSGSAEANACKSASLDAEFTFSGGIVNDGAARWSGTCGGQGMSVRLVPTGGLERGEEFIVMFAPEDGGNFDLTIIGRNSGGKAEGTVAVSFEGNVYEGGNFRGSVK